MTRKTYKRLTIFARIEQLEKAILGLPEVFRIDSEIFVEWMIILNRKIKFLKKLVS